MYLLLAVGYQWIVRYIPPLILFPIINNISILVNNSNSTFVFFKQACHANPASEKK